MDTTDRKIIKYLEENGRATIKEIAQNVNLSSPAVTERIKRLEEQEVIKGYHAEINYMKLGKSMQAMVSVDVDLKKFDKFCQFCHEKDSILSLVHIIGPYNALLMVAVEDADELSRLLAQINIFGVSQTSVILNKVF